MRSIKELEQKIDLMIIGRVETLGDLDKILKNPDDSNETKIKKALEALDDLKEEETVLLLHKTIYNAKNNDVIDNFKLKLLHKIMNCPSSLKLITSNDYGLFDNV